MYFEWLNQNLQIAVAVTEDIQSGNLSVNYQQLSTQSVIVKLFVYLPRINILVQTLILTS